MLAYEVGQTMSPAPSERRPTQAIHLPVSFWTEAANLEQDVDTSIQAAGTAVFFDMIWSRLYRPAPPRSWT
jgi:hypothetical protein